MIQEARGSCPVRSMLCLGSPEGLAGGVVAAVGAMYTLEKRTAVGVAAGRSMSNGCTRPTVCTQVQRLRRGGDRRTAVGVMWCFGLGESSGR